MPNWVYNSVVIDGDGAEVVELACKLVGGRGGRNEPFLVQQDCSAAGKRGVR